MSAKNKVSGTQLVFMVSLTSMLMCEKLSNIKKIEQLNKVMDRIVTEDKTETNQSKQNSIQLHKFNITTRSLSYLTRLENLIICKFYLIEKSEFS